METYARHLPGETHVLSSDGTWTKRCIAGEIVLPRLRSIDPQAVLVSFVIHEKEGENEILKKQETNCLVDLRQCSKDFETDFSHIHHDWNHSIFETIRIITSTMAQDDECEVDIANPNEFIQITNPWVGFKVRINN